MGLRLEGDFNNVIMFGIGYQKRKESIYFMSVPQCHVCNANPDEHQIYGDSGLEGGDYCPVCYRPTCKNHLVTVRFRWTKDRRVDSALVCIQCKKTYQHRYWDVANRDWIS